MTNYVRVMADCKSVYSGRKNERHNPGVCCHPCCYVLAGELTRISFPGQVFLDFLLMALPIVLHIIVKVCINIYPLNLVKMTNSHVVIQKSC